MAYRSVLSRFCFTLILLNAAIILQASSYPVTDTDKSKCESNCTKEAYSPVCATDGQTYNNTCLLECFNTHEGANLGIHYKDSCVTIPPPPEDLCGQHQKRLFSIPAGEYNRICNYQILKEKENNNTLSVKDLANCYDPVCTLVKEYRRLQCSYFFPNKCWCVDTQTGLAIDGTLEDGLQIEDCDNRNSCMNDDGIEIRDGGLFSPISGCGLCECLDGVITCFDDYVPDSDGELNQTQIVQLQNELVQLFYFQLNHEDHVLIDIRHIHAHPTIISAEIMLETLKWKFDYYDRNGNYKLTPGEQFLCKKEIESFMHCSSFFDHFIEMVDANSDEEIIFSEWSSFFEDDPLTDVVDSGSSTTSTYYSPQPVKRSISDQLKFSRHEKKKRYYYTLV